MSIRDLETALTEFAALTGRPVGSKLVERTLAEGEYKSEITPDRPEGLEIPDFLRREKPDRFKKKPAEDVPVQPETKISERLVTVADALAAFNSIQDAGYVRSKRDQISPTTARYTFCHHAGRPVQVKVERIGETYRITGADQILSEFDVAPGGPMHRDTMALGQADGDEIEEHLGDDAATKDYIDDFQSSDAPQFKGKSKEKRREMAVAASYRGK